MAKTAPDTSYRDWSVDELNAVKTSVLVQMKNIEATGQSHALNGRTTSLADFDKLVDNLASINAALAWKRNQANCGNNGYASRFANFNTGC